MQPLDPIIPLFVVFCVAFVFGVRLLLWRCAPTRIRNLGLPLIAFWFAGVEVMAAAGFWQQTESLGLRWAILAIPPLGLWSWIALTPSGRDLARRIPLLLLVGLQGLRAPVLGFTEILRDRGLMNGSMSWSGQFDLAISISAPLLAIWILKGRPHRSVLLVWNLMGLVLIIPGSAPEPGLLSFPFVAIPAVFVTVAGALHLLSLRRLMADG